MDYNKANGKSEHKHISIWLENEVCRRVFVKSRLFLAAERRTTTTIVFPSEKIYRVDGNKKNGRSHNPLETLGGCECLRLDTQIVRVSLTCDDWFFIASVCMPIRNCGGIVHGMEVTVMLEGHSHNNNANVLRPLGSRQMWLNFVFVMCGIVHRAAKLGLQFDKRDLVCRSFVFPLCSWQHDFDYFDRLKKNAHFHDESISAAQTLPPPPPNGHARIEHFKSNSSRIPMKCEIFCRIESLALQWIPHKRKTR